VTIRYILSPEAKRDIERGFWGRNNGFWGRNNGFWGRNNGFWGRNT